MLRVPYLAAFILLYGWTAATPTPSPSPMFSGLQELWDHNSTELPPLPNDQTSHQYGMPAQNEVFHHFHGASSSVHGQYQEPNDPSFGFHDTHHYGEYPTHFVAQAPISHYSEAQSSNRYHYPPYSPYMDYSLVYSNPTQYTDRNIPQASHWQHVPEQHSDYHGGQHNGYGMTQSHVDHQDLSVHAMNIGSPTSSYSVQQPSVVDRPKQTKVPYHPPARQYSVQREYEYVPNRDFPKVASGPAYKVLSTDQKDFIVEQITATRPITEKWLRTQLADTLTSSLAHDFLSNDVTRVDAAVERLYPIKERKKGVAGVPWMKGFDKAKRLEVIDKVAIATQQRKDYLRDYFIKRKVTPEIAQEILDTHYLPDIATLASKYGLIQPESELGRKEKKSRKASPWQDGVSTIQKKALYQRMIGYGVDSLQTCWDLFRDHAAPSGYGLRMLQADEVKFEQIMLALTTKGVALPD
ncbi:hypothetical protein CBS101457_000205 [Exobasidium rhododendri]|nr:hypothetical protein CBS101457_000205 [Exobasidium rhododendri]